MAEYAAYLHNQKYPEGETLAAMVSEVEMKSPVVSHHARHRGGMQTLHDRVREAQAIIAFEEDPHRAALDDNPPEVRVDARTWAAVFFLALSFAAPISFGFLAMAAVLVPVTQALGGQEDMAWVVGAWSLSTACSFSLAGPISDTFGRRNPILIGQFIVIVGCICGGVSQNVATLIVAETLIGFGCGIVFVAYAAVPEMLPNKWRSLGLGILEGGIAVPWGIVAVILGNAFLMYASWRWIFYCGIILEAIAFIGTALFYWPTARPRGDFHKSRWQEFKEMDWLGLSVIISGLAVFLVGLTWGGSEEHPWGASSTVGPLVVGLLVVIAGFVYDWTLARNPMFPWSLFAMFRKYTVLLVVLFVSGMNFHAMSPLLPQGALFMFTHDGIEIGVMSLPNTIMQGVVGVLVPMLAHKIGFVKWQIVLGMFLQTIFLAASAASVYPNNKLAFVFLPAFGVPMFIWVTIMSYAAASLHVPHSQLGVAMGLLGTFRSGGGAVGNAIFNSIFQDRVHAFAGEEVAAAAARQGLNMTLLPAIIPQAILYNQGVPGMLANFSQPVRDALQEGVRVGIGHAFKIVFLCTIPFSVIALVCSLWIEDPTAYMTNHVQFAMGRDAFHDRQPGHVGANGSGASGSDIDMADFDVAKSDFRPVTVVRSRGTGASRE